MNRPTRKQIGAYLVAVKAIADTIRDVGECPLGAVYAGCMNHMDLDTFNGIIRRLESSGLVSVSGASLVKWICPAI